MQFRILIVKLAAIGDVVMALSMLPALKKQYPNASITWLCGKKVADLIRATQLVDRIIPVDEVRLLTGSFFSKFWSLFKVWRAVFRERFDLVITAHPDPRYRLLTRFVRSKERRFLDRRGARMSPVSGRYHGSEYVRLATGIQEPFGSLGELPSIAIPTSRVLEKMKSQLRIAFAPGGARNVLAENAQRRWPIENYAKVMSFFARSGYQVLVTGSETDQWVTPHLGSVQFVNLIGKLDLLDLVAVYQSCDLLITHDSGPLHLAKLAKCKVLALFGPTNPMEFVSSTDSLIEVMWGGRELSCRPCYDGKTFAKCLNHKCLNSITPSQVIEKSKAILGLTEVVSIEN